MSSDTYRNGNWDHRKLNADGYRPGSVIRVKMVNFLTYDECEVFPGPRLNIILGPNGTGKSTVTHAIYLACNGSAGQLGRSSDLTKYVKNGKEREESYVEVDIYDKDEIHTIRRTIDSEKKSSKWKYNHSDAKQVQIKELMKKLKIDVENLCNFMSQDKVGTFSTFKPNHILQATLKCINLNSDGDEDKTLYDEQLALADVESENRDKEREKDTKQTIFDELSNQLTLMQREYDRFIERSETKKKLELYEIKLVFEQIKDMSNKVIEKQLLVDQATKLLLEAEKAIQPLETKERDLKRLQAVKAKNVDNARDKMNTSERAMLSRKEDITQAEVTLDSVYTDLELMDRQRKKLEDSRALKAEDLKKAEKELLDLNDRLPEIQKHMESLAVEIRKLGSETEACQVACDEKDNQLKKKKEELFYVRKEIGNLKDSSEIFQKKVSSVGNTMFRQDTTKLINLLKNQQQWRNENKITHDIYGPIAMYINVKDPAAAAMVEKCIPNNKLYGVIVRSDNDRDFLKRMFSEQRMKVDIYTMYEINAPVAPSVRNITTTFKDIGMQGYLLDQVETNDVVRAFLISNLNLHNVMWIKQSSSTREINDQDTAGFMGTGRYYRFFKYKPELSSGRELYIQEYNGSMSKYAKDGKINIQVTKIDKTGLIVSGSVDTSSDGDKNQLEAKLEVINKELRLIEAERKTLTDKFREITDARNAKQEKRRTFQTALKQPEAVQSKISGLQRQVKDLDKQLSIDINTQRQDRQIAYRNALSKVLANIELLLTASNTYRDFKVDWHVANASKEALLGCVERAVEAVRDAKMGLEQLKQDVRAREREREETEQQKGRFTKKLEGLNEKHGGTSKLQGLFAQAVSSLPETTVEDIERKVAFLDQELKGAVDNSSIVERYKSTETKLAKLKVELDTLVAACDSKRDFFQERSNHWQNAILALASKMNASFKTFMNQLQYDGAVKLRPTGTITDYEMVMEVCFRLNSTLVELSGHKHSGGERAVSTIMYLMAMQALTTSPFRVVDEINQGMDERNERLVFDRIVSTCCGNALMPQYFLVSPKLLQGLNAMDHPDVTVLLVLNGPGVKSTWNLRDVITGLKRNPDSGSSNDIGKENSHTSTNKKVKSSRG